jgi:hypothetical protein
MKHAIPVSIKPAASTKAAWSDEGYTGFFVLEYNTPLALGPLMKFPRSVAIFGMRPHDRSVDVRFSRETA